MSARLPSFAMMIRTGEADSLLDLRVKAPRRLAFA
jgi:hypothetical protein